MNQDMLQAWEMASYVVTVIGLPYALAMVMIDNYKERQLENEELYQKLAEEYAKFANLMIENADLRLMTGHIPEA